MEGRILNDANAAVLALAVCVLAVIAVLLATRPEQELFTELYFNDIERLPEYVEQGLLFNFSFSIANHEGTTKEYNYSVTKELYELDYDCEAGELYLEETNYSNRSAMIDGNYSVITRRAETNDPVMLVKEKDYNVSFIYHSKDGAGQVVLYFTGTDEREKYSIIISEEKQKVYISAGNRTVDRDVHIERGRRHKVLVETDQNLIRVSIDKRIVMETTEIGGYTNVFPAIELTNTFAYVSSFSIERRGQAQSVAVQFADTKYESIPLEEQSVVRQGLLLYQVKNITGTLVRSLPRLPTGKTQKVEYYLAEESVDLDTYTMELYFGLLNGSKMSIGMQDEYELIYDASSSSLRWESRNTSRRFTLSPKGTFVRMSVDHRPERTDIYFDGQFVSSMPHTKTGSTRVPFINKYDSDAIIREFSLKSNAEPYIITYDVPEESKEIVRYVSFADADIMIQITNVSTDEREHENILSLFEKEMVLWSNYTITSEYIDQDRNGTVSYYFSSFGQTLYSLVINSTIATFSYSVRGMPVEKSLRRNASLSTSNRVIIDVTGPNVTVSLNNDIVFSGVIDNTTNGALLMDVSGRILFKNTRLEQKELKEIKVYASGELECRHVLINSSVKRGTVTIEKGKTKSIDEAVVFDEKFDIAKLQVALSENQEIHFMVKQT